MSTDDSGLVAGHVTVDVGGFALPAYRAKPAGATNPPVLLMACEIFGLNDHMEDVARRFATLGWLAIVPDLFVRQGRAQAIPDVQQLIATIVAKASDAQVMADLDACAAWARADGGDAQRLGITGWCWGGRTVWRYAAHNPSLTTGVAWYGPVARAYHAGDPPMLDLAAQVRAPVLGLYGAADAGIPVEGLEAMRAALAAHGNTASEIVVYPDTPHAFFADYRPSYRPDTAADAWQRCTGWLRTHGLAP